MVSFRLKFRTIKRQFKFLILNTILLSVLTTSLLMGQHLEIPVKVEIENGKADDLEIKVIKDGINTFSQTAVSKLKLKLEYNGVYSIVFSKPGYITKTVEINTQAPDDHIKSGFEPYKIGVKLFKQYDGVNIAVYNQPVGKVRFDKDLDEFSYDTDYSKSILSNLQEAEAKLAEKAKEEKLKEADPPAVVAKPAVQKEESVVQKQEISKLEPIVKPPAPVVIEPRKIITALKIDSVQPKSFNQVSDLAAKSHGSNGEQTKDYLAMDGANDISSSTVVKSNVVADEVSSSKKKNSDIDSPPIPPKVISNDINPATGNNKSEPVSNGNIDPGTKSFSNRGNDSRSESYANAGNDVPKIILPHIGNDEGGATLNADGEAIIRRDFVEKNRLITLVKIIRGKTSTEYRRVIYQWGGPFYFVNDVKSISQNIFANATGVKD